jgi:hypothetical protein
MQHDQGHPSPLASGTCVVAMTVQSATALSDQDALCCQIYLGGKGRAQLGYTESDAVWTMRDASLCIDIIELKATPFLNASGMFWSYRTF